jgi:hypothetical protein
MGYNPQTFAKVELDDFLESLKTCLNSKGNVYYNKISGAVKCSNNDLSKLELIIYLVSQYDDSQSLDCIFTGSPFPGFVWDVYDEEDELPTATTNTYLQEFLDFAEKFCRECIVTSAPAPIVTESDRYAKAEDGVSFILLEDNVTKIEL